MLVLDMMTCIAFFITIEELGFELLGALNAAKFLPCLALRLGFSLRAWAHVIRSQSFQEPIDVVEMINDWQAMILQISSCAVFMHAA